MHIEVAQEFDASPPEHKAIHATCEQCHPFFYLSPCDRSGKRVTNEWVLLIDLVSKPCQLQQRWWWLKRFEMPSSTYLVRQAVPLAVLVTAFDDMKPWRERV